MTVKNSPKGSPKGSIEEYNDLVRQLRDMTTRHDDVAITSSASKMIKLAEWCVSTSRLNSIWPFSFGLACCAIEMMATAAPRFDMDRFGAGVFRGSPRQSDLMIVAGTVTYKMGECIRRLWHQMPEPKWVIAMGACATNGGPYDPHGYHVMKGVDLIIPVDVYTPGCPPRPESLIESLIYLQDMIRSGRDREVRAGWERTHQKQVSEYLAGVEQNLRKSGVTPSTAAATGAFAV